MALDVTTTPTADSQINALAKNSPAAWVELDQKIGIISGADLSGYQHRLITSDVIVNLNYVHDVYFFSPSSPAPYFVCIYRQGETQMHVLALHDKSLVPRVDYNFKYNVGKSAASELGLVNPSISVV
jgi:hypothetical protein